MCSSPRPRHPRAKGNWTVWCEWEVNHIKAAHAHQCFSPQSKTGALEGAEVDGFVKDMMGLVRVRHILFDKS